MDEARNPVLVIFRHDLRIADNRALSAAAASGKPVVAAFILDEESPGIRRIGAARRWWLHHSLTALAGSLKQTGVALALRRGAMGPVVGALQRECGADLVLWNRRYNPAENDADMAMEAEMNRRGAKTQGFDGQLLHDPATLRSGEKPEYRVFTPFWRALSATSPRDPADAPDRLAAHAGTLASDRLEDWKLLPTEPDWSAGLAESWQPGEAGALARLDDFLRGGVAGYPSGRDLPSIEATSRLSPHLAHGEITPFQIFAATSSRRLAAQPHDAEAFRRQIGWREFCHHQLYHNRHLASVNYNRGFDDFPWSGDENELKAWRQGRTGYPLVDAGMRQLWRGGWMHNRVRMVAASFLIKHLLIDWRRGEEWFWDTLVDADQASNAANWQWVAGSGADASPYFRIFNPVLQSKKFDADGDYIRRHVPELAGMKAPGIHEPGATKAGREKQPDLLPGSAYPTPVVEHRAARAAALEAYAAMKKS